MKLSNKAVQHLMRNPSAFMRYQTTGQVPRATRPDSPLIRLLESISPRDRQMIVGVKITTLGYMSGQIFHNAEQLYRWLKPSNDIYGSYPAGSWQDRGFQKKLTLDDLKAACKSFPKHLVE